MVFPPRIQFEEAKVELNKRFKTSDEDLARLHDKVFNRLKRRKRRSNVFIIAASTMLIIAGIGIPTVYHFNYPSTANISKVQSSVPKGPGTKNETNENSTPNVQYDEYDYKMKEVMSVFTSNHIQFAKHTIEDNASAQNIYSILSHAGTSNNQWNVLVENQNGEINNEQSIKIWKEIWSLRDNKVENLIVKITWVNQNNNYSIVVSNIGGIIHGHNYYTGEDFK